MSHPLQQQLEALSQRARKLVWLHGATRLAAIVIGAFFLLGLVDYLLRPADSSLRFVAFAVVIGAVVWCVLRYLQPAWQYRPESIEMARKLERRFPQLGQRLSSAAAFLGRGDQQLSPGSPQLQRMLIAETTATMESLPVADVFDLTPVKRSLLGFVLVAVVGSVLIGLDPASASVAARRLLVPWSETPWPRRNYLQLIDPPRSIARGEALELAVRDKSGRRVDDMQLQWRAAGETFSSAQSRRMKPLADRYVARLDNITESLDYRAIGGDDQSMPWHRLEVVDPPGLEQLSATITPPAYTRLGSYGSAPELRILAGSQVRLQGRADRPLERAELMVMSEPSHALVGKLADDNLSFNLPAAEAWQPEQTGEYLLRLFETGQSEVAAEFRYAVEVVPDRPPQATFAESPPTSAAVSASLPLTITLDDDLQVDSARLMVRRAGRLESPPQAWEVYRAAAEAGESQPASSADFLNTPWREQLEYQWELNELAATEIGPLQSGEELVYWLEAVDRLGQVGRGSERRLSLISAEQLNRRIGRRLTEIEAKLAEAMRLESELVGGSQQVKLQLTQVGTAGSGELDQLQSIELRQRQVESLLISRADSAAAMIRQALAEIEQNKIEQPTTSDRLEEYAQVIGRLGQQELPAAARELIATLKQLRADLQLADRTDPAARVTLSAASGQQLTQSLTSAEENQQAVVTALEELLGSLARWSDFHRFAEELGEIRRQQEQLMADTLEIRPDTIGRERRNMPSQLVAELDKLSLRQRELARRFEQLQGQMSATAAELKAADSKTSARLLDVFDEATRRGTAGRLRDGSRQIDSNRLGTASSSQEQAIADIEQLLGMLTGRKETDLEKIADQLGSEADQLSQLADRAEKLEQQAQAAAKESDANKQQQKLDQLDQEKQELAEEIERSRRRLERLEAKQSAAQAAQAGDALSDKQGEKPDAEGLQKQAGEATKKLREARQQLEEKVQQAEQDLFHEQIARLKQTLIGLTEREKSIVSEIDRLAQLSDEQGELSPAQLSSVAALAAEQRIVQQETQAAAAGLNKAAVFQLSLAGIARAMGRTADGLEAEQVDQPVRTSAADAVARLQQLAAALEQEPPPPADDQNQGGGDQEPPPPQDNAPPVDGVKLMAEVKLLKLMQLEINRRTLQIEQLRTAEGQLSEGQQQESAALAEEQGQLAELFANIVAALGGTPAEQADGDQEQPDPIPPDEDTPPEAEPENPEELEKELDELLQDLG